ncbi:hypothetical protein [Estrella lausannensis]|uniref:Uncharacterized protein n=1 Tax=Estrella lausannensis TaxID=483423 RepID=A0A0H5E4L5_9BACT|nr:hypothetical protein [Estrella lausannensis]CRX38165.1 hypothetical protein ELAC_0816 [Estrella lausannensis]
MNITQFTKSNTDCFLFLMGNMPLSTAYKMSCTCKAYHQMFTEVFKENREECCLLLESGKNYTAIVEPCILELKTALIGNLLLNKEAFENYVGVLSRTIAENFSEPALTTDPGSEIFAECNLLINDMPLFQLLCRHGFFTHLAQAFLEKHKAHKNNHLFFLFCKDMVNKFGAQHPEELEIIFEMLLEGWKSAFYDQFMQECKKSPEFTKAVITDLQTFDPAYLLDQEDVKGLVVIDNALNLHFKGRTKLSERLKDDIPVLFNDLVNDLTALQL